MMQLPFTLNAGLKGLLLLSILLLVGTNPSQAQSFQGLLGQKTSLADRLLKRTPISFQQPRPIPFVMKQRHHGVSAKLKVLSPMIQSLTPPDEDLQAQFCADQAGGEWITHYGMSLVTTLGMQYILETRLELPRRWAFVLSALSGLAIGFAKEYSDWKNTARNCFRSEDLWASSIGVLSGAVVIFTF